MRGMHIFGHFRRMKRGSVPSCTRSRYIQSSAAVHGNGANNGTTHHSKFMNPIVRDLWEQRQEAKQRMMSITDADCETTGSGAIQELTAKMFRSGKSDDEKSTKFKNPSASMTTIDYNFSSDEFLREAYRSPGGTMRFGKVLEDLDALAGNIAFHHVVGDNLMLVTAAVDRIALRNIPKLENDQRLSGQVTYVGSSSMEIRMQIHEISSDDKSDEKNVNVEHWLEGYFTFVAVNPETNTPVQICPLVPETSEERALFELGAMKAKKRKEARKKGSTVDGKAKIDRRAEQLMSDAFPLLHMPSLADPEAILMSSTTMQNSLIAQPQVRNLSNRIFGGFLMRRAFELAFANAYSFGGEWPQMLEVDNITFLSPVDVGDLLQFNSRVIYSLPEGGKLGAEVKKHSSKPLVMIEVECLVMEPEKAKARLSNRFYFTFVLPTKRHCRKILPGTIEESRRMVQRMVADEEQGLGKGYLLQYDLTSKSNP